jgi:Aerotolerance regulator N-terminal
MEMSLIHAGLAAGAALAALPVILHLFMRQTPKHVIFPALRLLRERQKQSKKRMRIKNWLLLLARMAILALMALALARPRVYSEVPLGDESQPIALGLVFDTSLSMEYKDKDKTRLEEAKARAKEIIAKIPDSSLVFVVDSGVPGVPIARSPAAAVKEIESLVIRPVNRPLNSALGQVYPVVAECERPVHAVYVLTDLARTSWRAEPAEGLEHAAKANKGKGVKIATFVWRLTPKEIQNVAVVAAEPESSVVTQGEPVEIRARIRSLCTAPVKRLAEFEVDGVKKGEKSIELPAGRSEQEVVFTTSTRLEDGEVHVGKVKLGGSPDPFERDDERFFVFKLRPPMKVLLISDRPYEAEFVAAALDPDAPGVARRYLVERVLTSQFAKKKNDLRAYACVFVLNVESLDEGVWGALNQYVHEGGGLVVAPGQYSKPESYNNSIPAQLLAAQLGEAPKVTKAGATFGKVANVTHPLFQKFGTDMDTVLGIVPVYRYWPTKPPVDGAHVLLTYSDGAPALLERTFKGPKTGRVLLWTTPLARRPDVGGAMAANQNAWSESASYWPFLVLMDQTVPYVAGASNDSLNFEAGENVLLKLEPTARFTKFLVTGPNPTSKPRLVPSPSNEFLEVIEPPELGIWSVNATGADNRTTRMGFSVNVPQAENRSESKFDPMTPQDLDTVFGKGNYKLAEDVQTMENVGQIARLGHEIFPLLMFLILIIVTLENFLANTFYKQVPQGKASQ